MKPNWKRPLAVLMVGVMIFTMFGMQAFAVVGDAAATHRGLCEHQIAHMSAIQTTDSVLNIGLCEHHPQKNIITWSFVENPDGLVLTEMDGKTAIMLPPEEGGIPFDQLAELLPREIRGEAMPTGTEADSGSPDPITIGISGWMCPEYKSETIPGEEGGSAQVVWPTGGEYIFIPQMEGDYAFDENPTLVVSFTPAQISLLANIEDTITITTNCVYANGIPIVIKENGSITSIYGEDGALLSGDTDVSKKWIFGGWSDDKTHSGNTSVTMESGTVTKNIYGGSGNEGTLEGSTEVVIKGGKVGWVYGGGEYDTVNGTAKVTIHPGSKIWGNSAGSDTANAFNRGTIFGGGFGGTVNRTEVTLLGGDFGWAYGGGYNSTVTTTDVKLLANPDNWCNVYGGSNGGSVETANLTVRGVNSRYAVFLYGGGWNDHVEEANITIGGDCRLAGNVGVYANGKGQNSNNKSTVGDANFVIDNFELVAPGNTTVCGPLVGTDVTGKANVLVTGTKSSTTSIQLFLKDIDGVTLEQCSAVLMGAEPADPGNPNQPLKLERLEVASSGEAVFTSNNTLVTIGELAGSGKLLFEGQRKQPTMITGVQKVSSTFSAPLQIVVRGVAMTIDGAVFISGDGISSDVGFLSGMPSYTAVKIKDGIQLKPSTEVKTPTQITLATFDKASYTYGETMTLFIEAKITGGAPLAGETVYINAGDAGTQVVSVVLDDEGKATLQLTVNSFLRDVFQDPHKQTLRALYQGSQQYKDYVCMMTLAGTDEQNFTFTDANIALTQEITAPALNTNPVRELEVGDAFFTAEVVWSPDTTVFQADTPYSASLLLKPKQAYDFKSVGTITYQGVQIIPQKQPDGSLLLPKVKEFAAIPLENLTYKTKTEQESLDTVPTELQRKFSSTEELKEALYKETVQQMAEILENNMAYYDVQLHVSQDGGVTWETAIPGNFPKDGIEVTLPYPPGTKGSTHDFVVTHMLTRSMNGKNPGNIEIPTIQETDLGITFRVYSLSPISVGWKRVADEPDSPSSEDSFTYKTEQKSLDTVPTELQGKFYSIEELKNALYKETVQQKAKILENNMAYYDVQLYVSQDGGVTWETAIPENFPKDGIEVTLPYPTGTKESTHDFVVAHMLTRSTNGKNPGDIEFPAIQETESGITFRVYSLSPVSVGWKRVADEPHSGSGDSLSSGGSTSGSSDFSTSGGSNSSTSGDSKIIDRPDKVNKSTATTTEETKIIADTKKNPVPAFTDITGHWAKDDILFVTSRGLLSGTSEITFSPNTGMTRGMFVTALGRLAGIDPDSYQTGKFTDVKADAYYAPYVNWAAKTGIVDGTTATTFAPDSNITREQMAVIMKNYAKKLGYSIPKTLEAVIFADNAKISSWAKDAVKTMQQAGILAGKSNNQFAPKETATRAEVATVLRRFVEMFIDPQTANG